MKFIQIGEGAKVDGLKLERNIVVTDDMSQVVFVDVGKNGEVINLDAHGNQVLTPEAYRDYLVVEIEKNKIKLKEFADKLMEIDNDTDKARINRQLKLVLQELDASVHNNSNFNYKMAISKLRDICLNLGYGVLSGILTKMIGF
ncbi:hypothetical protein [Aeromonas caviae]|uniref:hypothetical protein n=1 Tax=Aeromonas caviae TaxID=648 RepID=UPI003F745E15